MRARRPRRIRDPAGPSSSSYRTMHARAMPPLTRARHASFLKSAAGPDGYPPPGAPEIAFAGRSNVGKASLLNTLVGVPGLARTSSTPGRTQLLNWFKVVPPTGGPELAFVDLPGYGYAKVPQKLREGWRPLVEKYVTGRATLRLVVLIMDVRRAAESEEEELLEWLGSIEHRGVVDLTR